MTALTQYSRLEATALWRQTPEAQRREVIVSIGDATLVIANINDQALTHWSLAAVVRANPTVSPAVFHPDGDPRVYNLEEKMEDIKNIAEIIKDDDGDGSLTLSVRKIQVRVHPPNFCLLYTSPSPRD